jgi:hypothetical protein
MFSLFVLALWVFLISASQHFLGWFTVDDKLIGIVGIILTIALVLEGWFWVRSHPWLGHRPQ